MAATVPVTLGIFYADYAGRLDRGTLPIDRCRCPDPDCGGGLRLAGTVERGLVDLVDVEYGEAVVTEWVRSTIVVALARCRCCRRRVRVLPADVLARKQYSARAIEHLAGQYQGWQSSLREVAWQVHGDGPAHTTLWAWTEGLGAYALGRPGGEVDGVSPSSRVVAEVAQRYGAPDDEPTGVPCQRFKTEARRDRLGAGARLLVALSAIGAVVPCILATVNQLLDEWRVRPGVGFRTGISCTPIEQLDRRAPAPSRNSKEEPSCPTTGRSPPGDTSRSRH